MPARTGGEARHDPVHLRACLTCPRCDTTTVATMPTDQCLYFYECPGCRSLLRPKPGDCCVFCSYGDRPCPPKASGDCCA